MNELEARAGIEPAHRAFAELGLTTWLPRHLTGNYLTISNLSSTNASTLSVVVGGKLLGVRPSQLQGKITTGLCFPKARETHVITLGTHLLSGCAEEAVCLLPKNSKGRREDTPVFREPDAEQQRPRDSAFSGRVEALSVLVTVANRVAQILFGPVIA